MSPLGYGGVCRGQRQWDPSIVFILPDYWSRSIANANDPRFGVSPEGPAAKASYCLSLPAFITQQQEVSSSPGCGGNLENGPSAQSSTGGQMEEPASYSFEKSHECWRLTLAGLLGAQVKGHDMISPAVLHLDTKSLLAAPPPSLLYCCSEHLPEDSVAGTRGVGQGELLPRSVEWSSRLSGTSLRASSSRYCWRIGATPAFLPEHSPASAQGRRATPLRWEDSPLCCLLHGEGRGLLCPWNGLGGEGRPHNWLARAGLGRREPGIS